MKDLEKIKSEEVAAQVQDANPGNFAIEQEVAQLVGATVPAPTAPSADDARELGAQLLVFLRRALLPIRSALRTAVAAIYAHLDSRCTDYTPAAYDPFRLPAGPYDPMRPLTPRTLPNLLTALTAFAPRKISGVPEAADGVSLVHLLCSAASSEITELIDDNEGWTMTRQFPWSAFPNIKKAVLGFASLPQSDLQIVANYSAMEELTVKVEEILIYGNKGGSGWGKVYNMAHLKRIVWKGLKRYETPDGHSSSYEGLICLCPELEEFIAEDLEYVLPLPNYTDNAMISKCGALKKVVVGTLKAVRNWAYSSGADSFINTDCPNFIHFEIGQGSDCSIRMTKWSPTNALDASRTDLIEQGSTAENNLQQFLQNFREYIALRLTANGTGKTLTLSQAVRNAIHAAESTYGIENIIVTQKGWTISPAPN